MDILHPSRPNVSRADLAEKLAALYKTDKDRVVAFGLRTQFGGGRSTGFALIYDDEASQKKFEPKYRLVRVRYICLPYAHTYLTMDNSQVCRQRWISLLASCERSERTGRRKLVTSYNSGKARWLMFSSQLRGTKKVKAAEPPKKGK